MYVTMAEIAKEKELLPASNISISFIIGCDITFIYSWPPGTPQYVLPSLKKLLCLLFEIRRCLFSIEHSEIPVDSG